ncbi:MAG: hypothetical protein RID53_10880 [Coleofasciculus sp. B1-GNL1-01]|uniref:hypothetical protein n=1 Tax=Coleofasciculus sp. B1-GNL1-01 TaxID=3068484 RepID=UPI0033027A9F
MTSPLTPLQPGEGNKDQEKTDGEWNSQLHKQSPPARTDVETELTETTTWSQCTVQQFFSGYSEADAIYDNI